MKHMHKQTGKVLYLLQKRASFDLLDDDAVALATSPAGSLPPKLTELNTTRPLSIGSSKREDAD